MALEKPLDEQVIFQQTAAAAPPEPGKLAFVDRPVICVHTARRTISSLILPMAIVGFNPFGHTSTQFMIVWHRNRRYGSSRLSSRSFVASSRLSAMKR